MQTTGQSTRAGWLQQPENHLMSSARSPQSGSSELEADSQPARRAVPNAAKVDLRAARSAERLATAGLPSTSSMNYAPGGRVGPGATGVPQRGQWLQSTARGFWQDWQGC